MKKFLSIILLSLFLYNVVGYFPLFLLKRADVRSAIKQQIKNSVPGKNFTEFVFSEKEFSTLKWSDKNEFRYNGNMYDVVKNESDKNGNIHLYCINDKKEKELFANLEEQVQKNIASTASGNQTKNIIKLFSGVYLPIDGICFFDDGEKTASLPEFQPSFISFIRDNPSPPPKVLV